MVSKWKNNIRKCCFSPEIFLSLWFCGFLCLLPPVFWGVSSVKFTWKKIVGPSVSSDQRTQEKLKHSKDIWILQSPMTHHPSWIPPTVVNEKWRSIIDTAIGKWHWYFSFLFFCHLGYVCPLCLKEALRFRNEKNWNWMKLTAFYLNQIFTATDLFSFNILWLSVDICLSPNRIS